MRKLKLYRGISADEFQIASDEMFKRNRRIWSSILERRAKGDFSFPGDLDKDITSLHRHLRLEYQYFTDTREIAEAYAKKVRGLIVEITVPVKEIVANFDIEFQNFGRRKKRFEVVYCVKASMLGKFAKRWTLKVRKK